MAALTVTSENTVDQHQQMTWQPKHHWLRKLNTGLQEMDSVSLHSSSRLCDLIYKWNATFTFIWKEDFGPLITSPVVFLLSPGKMLLMMFLFQKWLVALFLKMSERGDSWCTDSSFSSLLWSSPKCLNRLCLTVFSSLRHPVLCTFPPNFFLPVNFAFNMLWYSTPWTAPPPFSNALCDLLSLWGCQWSSSGPLPSQQCSHYCVSKNKRYPEFILYGCHLLKLKCKYSNILRYDFWLSSAVISNHQK